MPPSREEYLADLAASLPLPSPIRDDVLEELDSHLTDSIAALEARGRDRSAAEAEALSRLGPAGALAKDLAKARRRGTDRLLAAAGGGTIAAVRTAIPATFVAWLLVALVTLITILGVRALGRALGLDLQVSTDDGWNTALAAIGFNVGALLTGAAAVRGAARSGWRTPDEVRPGVIVVGAAAAGWLSLVSFADALNWASVATLLAVPVSFSIGARVDRARPPRMAAVRVVIGFALILIVVLSQIPGSLSTGRGYSWDDTTHEYGMVGPWWQDRSSDTELDFPQMSLGLQWVGADEVSVTAADAAVLASFHDFRAEAWRAEPPQDGWRLLPGQSKPFATAPMQLDDLRASGLIRYDQTPGVEWTQIIVTAVGRDGVRYILAAGGPERTIFHGSVLSWFEALLR